MNITIQSLEDQLSKLIEKNFTNLWSPHVDRTTLILQLAKALEIVSKTTTNQQIQQINFTITLNPETLNKIRGTSSRIDQYLSSELLAIANNLDISMTSRPIVILKTNSTLKIRSITIDLSISDNENNETVIIDNQKQLNTADHNKPYIIVNGRYNHFFENSLITIGRHLENDIIIENTKVSRHHAQIRLKLDEWVLYDTNSTLGTIINNQPIKEQVLENGDVIQIANNKLIFVYPNQTEVNGLQKVLHQNNTLQLED
ncbi:MAG TPA: hypothetical protein DCL76_02075 [Chloroflexi bacterium]|nr:hypothetical protein [Chloroflexota bacterium]